MVIPKVEHKITGVRICIMTTSENEGAPWDSRRSWKSFSVVIKFQVLRLTLTDNENEVLTDSGEMQVPRGTGQWKRLLQGIVV